MLNLYDQREDYLQAFYRLNEMEDVTSEMIKDTLEGLSGEFSDKAMELAKAIKSMEHEADSIGLAEYSMAVRRKRLEHTGKRLKAHLKESMELMKMDKIKSSHLVVSIRNSPGKVIVDAAELIPEEYWIKPEPQISIAAIKAALKSGEVPGARIEKGTILQIN